MRIGYVTYYNTPDNLRIALEDNLIEISPKNSENHKLRIIYKHFRSNCPTMQCGLSSYVMYVFERDWALVLPFQYGSQYCISPLVIFGFVTLVLSSDYHN